MNNTKDKPLHEGVVTLRRPTLAPMNVPVPGTPPLRKHRAMACCELAVPFFCVCAYSYRCPVHGERHYGSHE